MNKMNGRTFAQRAGQKVVTGAIAAVLVLLGAGAATAQGDASPVCWIRGDPAGLANRASSFDSTTVRLDAGEIKVCYSRPRRQGRTIMGGLVPFDQPWRLGANEATAIRVSFPASIAGVAVEPGWYTLYVLPAEDEWQVVVNGAIQRWGVPINAGIRGRDIGSAVVAVEPTQAPVDVLQLTLQRVSGTEATLVTEWEQTRVRIPIRAR